MCGYIYQYSSYCSGAILARMHSTSNLALYSATEEVCLGCFRLKNEIVSEANFDPVTKKPYASIHDAQSDALAVNRFSGCPASQGGLTSQGQLQQPQS